MLKQGGTAEVKPFVSEEMKGFFIYCDLRAG
jgi:hypothetical protein